MYTSTLLVTPSALHAAQADIRTTVADVNQQSQDLRSFVSPLCQSWSGSAAEAWDVLQRRWDTSLADLNAVLGELGTMVGTYAADAELRNQQNTSTWAS